MTTPSEPARSASKIALLDVNLLVALAWPNHVHHDRALQWFRENREAGWATCPATQSGFVRVSSNRKVIPEARTPHEAILLLRRIVDVPGHRFWTDDVSVASVPEVDPARLIGYRQVTDAHLLALSIRRGGRLATLDRGIEQLVPAPHEAGEVLALVPALP